METPVNMAEYARTRRDSSDSSAKVADRLRDAEPRCVFGFRFDPVSAPYATQGLNKTQFQQEILKLDSNDPDYGDKYNALIQRRAVGKRLNLQ